MDLTVLFIGIIAVFVVGIVASAVAYYLYNLALEFSCSRGGGAAYRVRPERTIGRDAESLANDRHPQVAQAGKEALSVVKRATI